MILPKLVADFDEFLNEPPEYEEKLMVRDYRYQAYRKWSIVRDELEATIELLERRLDGSEKLRADLEAALLDARR